MLFVIPRGFEPRTHSLEGCCSIQLSYETNLFVLKSFAKLLKKNEFSKHFLFFLYTIYLIATNTNFNTILQNPLYCLADFKLKYMLIIILINY